MASALYQDFVDRLLYQDTIQSMRQSLLASGDFDKGAVRTVFERAETRAKQNGWTHTAALIRFVREQAADVLEAPALGEVTGPENLIANAMAAPSAMRALTLLRRHRPLVSLDLYDQVVTAARMDRQRPTAETVRLMYSIARLLGDRDKAVESRLLWANLHSSSSDFQRAERHLRLAAAVAGTANPRLRLATLCALGALYRSMLDYPRAIAAFERSLEVTNNDGAQIHVWESLAYCYRNCGQPANAVDACGRALQAAERAGITDRLPQLLGLRALSHEDLGDYEQGRSDHLRAAQHAELTGDRRAQFLAISNAAESLLKRGLAREGCRARRNVLRTAEEWGDPDMVAASHNNLGNALNDLEQFAEAREHFARSLAMRAGQGPCTE